MTSPIRRPRAKRINNTDEFRFHLQRLIFARIRHSTTSDDDCVHRVRHARGADHIRSSAHKNRLPRI